MNYKRTGLKILIYLTVALILGSIVNQYLQRHMFFPLWHYEEVKKQADKYNIDPLLIMAVIKAESNFKTEAVSNKDAVGLMQITPETARWAAEEMGIENYTDDTLNMPETNITIGVWYISYLSDYYQGDTDLALAAYNAGAGTVDGWIKDDNIQKKDGEYILPYKETSDYLLKIDKYRNRYTKLYKDEVNSK